MNKKVFHPQGTTKGLEKIPGCAASGKSNKDYRPTHRKPSKAPQR